MINPPELMYLFTYAKNKENRPNVWAAGFLCLKSLNKLGFNFLTKFRIICQQFF
jgi:hypothetical protein